MVFVGILLIDGCCCFFSNPFPSIPTPIRQVNIAYTAPRIDPTNDIAYFVKVVTQEYLELYSKSKGFGFSFVQFNGYEPLPMRKWAKVFLCQSKADGSQPTSRCEIFSEVYSSSDGPLRPKNWDSWNALTIHGFDVLWKQQKALVFLHSSTNNLKIIDLRTGATESQTFRVGQSGEYLSITPFDNETKVLLGGYDDHRCIDFKNNQTQTNVFKGFDGGFKSSLAWNEAEKLFAADAIGQIFIYNTKFEMIDKFKSVELKDVLRAKQRKKQPPPHKYAWVVDQLWSLWLPQQPKTNDSVFKLKTHTIEHKRISSANAASIW